MGSSRSRSIALAGPFVRMSRLIFQDTVPPCVCLSVCLFFFLYLLLLLLMVDNELLRTSFNGGFHQSSKKRGE